MPEDTQSFKNRLLELLDHTEFQRLLPHLEPMTFEYRQALYEPNEPIKWVYFPITGVASLVNTMADGSAVEVGTIGNEGIVGLPVVLGDQVDSLQCIYSGARLRVTLAVFGSQR
jgi:CRP-like cAMP-binding protein